MQFFEILLWKTSNFQKVVSLNLRQMERRLKMVGLCNDDDHPSALHLQRPYTKLNCLVVKDAYYASGLLNCSYAATMKGVKGNIAYRSMKIARSKYSTF